MAATESLGEYTEEEFQSAFESTRASLLLPPEVGPKQHPEAVLLGGQSGAGKTTLHAIISQRLHSDVIIVNGDEYRSRHPRYHELDEAFGMESVAHTAKWAGAMTEALIDEFSRMGYSLVIEGTLRTAEVPMKTARLLRERGYAVSLALMAVKPEISLLSCQIRYELMRIAGAVARATDPAHHNKIVRDIVGNLAALERSGLFDGVQLYSRAKELLYPPGGSQAEAAGGEVGNAGEGGGDGAGESAGGVGTASEALRDVLFGAWTPEEQEHLESLKEQLAELKKR